MFEPDTEEEEEEPESNQQHLKLIPFGSTSVCLTVRMTEMEKTRRILFGGIKHSCVCVLLPL